MPWISLVNIVAGEEVVPELLQDDVNAARLEEEGAVLLEDPAPSREDRSLLSRRSKASSARRGGSDRAADAILEALEPESQRQSVGQ